MNRLLGAAVLLSLAGRAAPPSWDLDAARRQALDDVLDAAVAAGDLPGVVVMVTTRDTVLYDRAVGVLDPVAGRPLAPDTIFNIASMTKPITSVAAMMLVDEGKVALDDPASRYLPELAGREVLVSVDSGRGTVVTRPATREVTVRARRQSPAPDDPVSPARRPVEGPASSGRDRDRRQGRRRPHLDGPGLRPVHADGAGRRCLARHPARQ